RVLARNLQGFSKVLYAQITEDNWEKHEEAVASYVDEVEDFHETTFRASLNTDAHLRNFEKTLHQDKAQHVEGINKILTNLKEVHDDVKENHELNNKVLAAVEAAVTTQNDHLAKWVESSASLAWCVGPRLTKIKNTEATIQSNMATLKTDTADIKAMVTGIFYAFKGQAFFAPSRSVPKPKLTITGVPATVGGRNKHA
ncbi:hypothetical protein Tco_0029588, partial [Tanacetum coccineum]